MLEPEIAKVHTCQSCLRKCIPMNDGDKYVLPGGEIVNVKVCFDCHRNGKESYLFAAARSEAHEQGWTSLPWNEAVPGQIVFKLSHKNGRMLLSGPFTVTRKHVLNGKTRIMEHGEVLIIATHN